MPPEPTGPLLGLTCILSSGDGGGDGGGGATGRQPSPCAGNVTRRRTVAGLDSAHAPAMRATAGRHGRYASQIRAAAADEKANTCGAKINLAPFASSTKTYFILTLFRT